MSLPDIFHPNTVQLIILRIENLNPNSKAIWGKMNVSQMLAHCNVTYEMVFTDKHPKPNVLMQWILKMFVKNKVVGTNYYPQNSPTAPQFIIKTDKNFADEKARLIDYLQQVSKLGAGHFDGKVSHSFGKLSANEWNNMFYKHLDHHLKQFNV